MVASQDLQGKVVLAVLGHLALLDQGVPQATWEYLGHRVLLASLDIVTPPRVLLTALEVSVRLLRALRSYTMVTTNLCGGGLKIKQLGRAAEPDPHSFSSSSVECKLLHSLFTSLRRDLTLQPCFICFQMLIPGLGK